MTHRASTDTPLGPPDPVLSALVLTALGEASMCWSPTPHGIFDAERAERIGTKLIDDIRRRGYR